MDSLTFEIRESGGELHGTIIQEGRAATGGRAELFAPNSISWPADGISIRTRHYGEEEVKGFPHRDRNSGEIRIRGKATDGIRAAIENGKRYMSIEFRALQEEVTKAGVREIQKALMVGAALVDDPEYGHSRAEIRNQGRRRRPWL